MKSITPWNTAILALALLCADAQAAAQDAPSSDIGELPEATLLNAQAFGERIVQNIPTTLIRHDYEGTVRILVRVDVIGRATDCQVIESSGNSIIDTWACLGTERYARFAPATDGDGKPVESKWSDAFTLALGDPARTKPEPEP